MSDNVTKLHLVSLGEEVRLDASAMFEAAKEYKFGRVTIIGELEDGEIYFAGNANFGETLVLIELAKHRILFGDGGA